MFKRFFCAILIQLLFGFLYDLFLNYMYVLIIRGICRLYFRTMFDIMFWIQKEIHDMTLNLLTMPKYSKINGKCQKNL